MGLEGTFWTNAEGAKVRAETGAQSAMREILGDVQSLAPYMRIMRLPRIDAPTEQRQKLRNAFDRDVKNDFIRWLAWEREDELKATFGLTDGQLGIIHTEGLISGPFMPNKLLVCTVDHIKPLGRGGGNGFSNLCIIPDWINTLKDIFEKIQIARNPAATHVNVLVPLRDQNGNYFPIPHFPDEFYEARAERIKRRLSQVENHTPPTPYI